MPNIYKNDSNLDVDNQINKILKGSTPITNLTKNASSSSESSSYSEIKPIKNKKKKKIYQSKNNSSSQTQNSENDFDNSISKNNSKHKASQTINDNIDNKIISIKPSYAKLKDAFIILLLYIILSSDQVLFIFNKYIPNLGKDSNNNQLFLGLLFRGMIFIVLFFAVKKYVF